MKQNLLSKDKSEKSLVSLNQQKNGVCVKIYVAEHCSVCDYTYEIAATIQRKFPEVDLEIVDMANPSEQIPENVFATPTYLLNGQVWSLGNPSHDQVSRTLSDIIVNT